MPSLKDQRKRRRKKFSCSNCQIRKKKCDRKSPCSLCVKLNCEDTCRYISAAVPCGKPLNNVPQQVESNSVGSLELLNKDMLFSEQPFVILDTLYPSGFPHSELPLRRGLMSLITMTEADPATQLIREYVRRYALSRAVDEPNQEIETKSKEILVESYIPRIESNTSDEDLKRARLAISNYGATIAVTLAEDENLTHRSLIDQILTLLPSYPVVVKEISYFFTDVCGYPVLHESSFKTAVETLYRLHLKTLEDGYILDILQFPKSYLATIASLLLVLRFNYIALAIGADRVDHLIVPLDTVNTVENILRVFDHTYDTSWELIQASLLLYVYRLQAPESDCYTKNGRPEVALAEIMTMTKSMLSVSEVSLEGAVVTPLWTNFKKSLCYLLALMDVERCVFFGKCTDVTWPTLSKDLPQPSITESRSLTSFCSILHIVQPLVQDLRSLISKTLCEEATESVQGIIQTMSSFQEKVDTSLGRLSDYLINTPSLSNCFKFHILLVCKAYLLLLYYSLYLAAETKQFYEFSYYCLEQQISIAFSDFSCLNKRLLKSGHLMFDHSSRLLLPVFVACNRLQFLSCRVRVRSACTMKESLIHNSLPLAERCRSIMSQTYSVEGRAYEFIEELGMSYRLAFVQAKSHYFGQRVFTKDCYLAFDPELSTKTVFHYPEESLERIDQILFNAASSQLFIETACQLIDEAGSEDREDTEVRILQLEKMWNAIDQMNTRSALIKRRALHPVLNSPGLWSGDLDGFFPTPDEFLNRNY